MSNNPLTPPPLAISYQYRLKGNEAQRNPDMNPSMIICAKNTSQLCDIIASLVASGIGFEADGATLTITLTGAY